jgi:hypothetical protein
MYEYKIVRNDFDKLIKMKDTDNYLVEQLNIYGAEGWILAYVGPNHQFYLYRLKS